MATQLQMARQGIITDAMKEAAEYDNVSPEFIRAGIEAGTITLCKNINHDFPARAIGKGLTTKINVNIGTSASHCDFDEEMEKMQITIDCNADAVMDLSTGGDLDVIRTRMIEKSPLMIGTVPLYALAEHYSREGKDVLECLDGDTLFAEIEKQAQQGVDFMTVHCGITKESLRILQNTDRIMGIVSRGGSMLAAWIRLTGNENPLFERYDELLDIAVKYDVTLSLGDGFRPGAIHDADDRAQIMEMIILGDLAKKAREKGVQVMIEGPGHVPLSRIEGNMLLQKKLCENVPYYVLGPLPTDIAPGYDHIVSAIGGSIAAAKGADFLCYVTPAEHLKLPDAEDVRQGIMASKIAAHIGDIEKGVPGAAKRDFNMSVARKDLNWTKMYELALDPVTAKAKRKASEDYEKDYCSMCGSLCAIKNDNIAMGKTDCTKEPVAVK